MGLLGQLLLVLALWSSRAWQPSLRPQACGALLMISTGKPRGLVRITEVNGQYQGRLEKTFPQPGEDPNPKCDKCSGSRRDQPVIGMTILWGMTKQGEEYQNGRSFGSREWQDLSR